MQELYYGEDEKPVISTENHCAGLSYKYDDFGKIVNIEYLGLDGKKMIRRDLGCGTDAL